MKARLQAFAFKSVNLYRYTTAIQSHWRSYTVRRNFGKVKRASGVIQACYRGYRGRKRAHNFSVKVAAEGRQKHFHQAAIEIQRLWRGSNSRKRIHSFYDRKRYLESVLSVGEQLRQSLNVHHETQSQAELLEKVRLRVYHARCFTQCLTVLSSFGALQESNMRETFLNAIRGMHHLTSTEVMPGVYNSPFTAVLGGPPQVGLCKSNAVEP